MVTIIDGLWFKISDGECTIPSGGLWKYRWPLSLCRWRRRWQFGRCDAPSEKLLRD